MDDGQFEPINVSPYYLRKLQTLWRDHLRFRSRESLERFFDAIEKLIPQEKA